jgi:hypothetical protein
MILKMFLPKNFGEKLAISTQIAAFHYKVELVF